MRATENGGTDMMSAPHSGTLRKPADPPIDQPGLRLQPRPAPGPAATAQVGAAVHLAGFPGR